MSVILINKSGTEIRVPKWMVPDALKYGCSYPKGSSTTEESNSEDLNDEDNEIAEEDLPSEWEGFVDEILESVDQKALTSKLAEFGLVESARVTLPTVKGALLKLEQVELKAILDSMTEQEVTLADGSNVILKDNKAYFDETLLELGSYQLDNGVLIVGEGFTKIEK